MVRFVELTHQRKKRGRERLQLENLNAASVELGKVSTTGVIWIARIVANRLPCRPSKCGSRVAPRLTRGLFISRPWTPCQH